MPKFLGNVLVELQQCTVTLGGRTVLSSVDFTLRAGERWALFGPNGAGKTLLLKLLRGDIWPTPDGRELRRYHFDGEISTQPRDLKHHLAYVGPERQDKYVRLGWNLRVSEVVITGLFDEDIPLTAPSRAQRARVQRALRRFGIWSLRRRRMLTLSYGQRRLVLVARAFVSDAQVLLLDEVFNGLDAAVKRKLRKALEARGGPPTWLITSHRPHELPRTVNRWARMHDGRLTMTSRENVLIAKPRDPLPSIPPTPLSKPRRPRAASDWLVRIEGASLYRAYRPVIQNLDWTLTRGVHWGVLGANGVGKSTVLSLIYGDLHPALGGSIARAGHARGAPIEAWKRRVGWMSPELQADYFHATSLEEIVISGRYASVGLNAPPTPADRRASARWLRFFALHELRKRGPREVSYGQLRLTLIARAVVNNPELLLLDEPCAGLDPDVRAHVLHVIDELANAGVQIVMAVHDPEDLPRVITQVLHIKRGGAVELRTR